MIIKPECDVEETYVRDDQQYMEETGMTRTFIEEDTPTEISTGHAMEKPSKDRLTLSPGCRMEDEDITGDHVEEEEKCLSPESFLSEHQRFHTNEKKHFCSECGKGFPRRYDFNLHLRSHTGEKPYPCPQCGKCFSIKSNRAKHQRTHTGEKPFCCLECGKCFTQKAHLISHQKSHPGERPYSCYQCGNCFTEKSDLIKHQRTHTSGKAYSCSSAANVFEGNLTLLHIKDLAQGNSAVLALRDGYVFLSSPVLTNF
ncbi:oocyte zinc finger protein XlCOF6.1-like [Rana temporaria]|uniref:oocyte zinc finger protein XlCOF6.1-like n=1 Tax=Rana temporaria TaxID=8407 RepID=UPI001AAE04D5|nr:oocyte zinc finger protein XlCOF6.1-like [Rana temporaria]